MKYLLFSILAFLISNQESKGQSVRLHFFANFTASDFRFETNLNAGIPIKIRSGEYGLIEVFSDKISIFPRLKHSSDKNHFGELKMNFEFGKEYFFLITKHSDYSVNTINEVSENVFNLNLANSYLKLDYKEFQLR